MKSEKTGKVTIQLENNIHNQERDKTQKKTEKIQETRVLRACLKQNILDILINQIKLFTRYNFTFFLKMGRDLTTVKWVGKSLHNFFFLKFSFFSCVIDHWNSLPNNTVSAGTFSSFKARLKSIQLPDKFTISSLN